MASTLSDRHARNAEKFAQKGKFEDALREYRLALEYAPSDLQLMNTVGDLCIRTGRNQDAIKYFTFIAKKYAAQNAVQRAIATLKKVAKLDPNNSDVPMLLGDLYRQQGHAAEAKHQYKAASTAFRRTGNLSESLKALNRVAELDQSSSDRADLGESYLRTGFTEEANQAFVQAAQECLRNERLDEAVKLFERVLQFRSDSRPALKGLVEAYTRLGKQERALRMLDGAIAASPDDIDLLVILGRTYLSAGMLAESEHAFDRLVKLDETRYVYLLEVANALIEQGAYQRVVRIVERCADLMIARRHKKRATALLKEVVKRDNENVEALELLALIYGRVGEKRNLSTTLNALVQVAYKLGLRETAVEALQRLADLEPGKKVHRERLESIESSPDIFASFASIGSFTRDDLESVTSDSAEFSTELLQDVMAQHPEFRAAQVRLIEDLIASQPAYVEGRIKLKRHYLESGMPERAVEQCEEIAKLYKSRGDESRAKGFLDEAAWLRAQFLGIESADATEPSPHGEPVHASTLPKASAAAHAAPYGTIVQIPLSRFLAREFGRAAREMTPLSIAKIEVIGVDPSTPVEQVQLALEQAFHRPADIVVVIGANALLAVMPDTHAKGATAMAERIRATVAELGRVRARVGFATVVPQTGGSPDDLLAEADLALRTSDEGTADTASA
jgi:tetratricopeptide (TPR) repeat protein